MERNPITDPKDPNPTPWETDEAKRVADNFNARLVFTPWDELRYGWMAFKLSDGSSDGVVYDSKRAAVKHQFSEQQCAYLAFQNCPNGITPSEAGRFLMFTRKAYDAGMRLPDPEDQFGGPDVFMPTAQFDRLKGIHGGR